MVASRQPKMVKHDWVKPGAIVIDVGINSVPGEQDTLNPSQPSVLFYTNLVSKVMARRAVNQIYIALQIIL